MKRTLIVFDGSNWAAEFTWTALVTVIGAIAFGHWMGNIAAGVFAGVIILTWRGE